ncbi:MAG: hypothetical protein FDX21_08785 [Chlorobium sp.]|nr:MAG: hypothetical protein FDX21_08785 [Chlorobium sp.]
MYHYRIFDRYKRPVAILAVLADSHKNWKPTSYGFTVLGSKLSLEFPLAKLTDYEKRLDELLESDNVFGWITAAHILTKKTKKLLECRFGLLPEWVSEQIKSAKSKDLEAWCEAVLTAPTLEDVFKKSDVS